jgi:lysyl-tRNA synthetase class 2
MSKHLKTNENLFLEENFQIFDVTKELEDYFKFKFNFSSGKEDFYKQIEEMFNDYFKLKTDSLSSSRLNIKKKIEKLIDSIIEPKCQLKPSFIINHPTILSPLAKSHDDNNLLSERFELFINGIEVINAYSELSNPEEQKERLLEQRRINEQVQDDEVHPFDSDYLEALSHGMPPTAGWGMGIDRMCMILLNQTNIKEVILFPLMNVKKK